MSLENLATTLFQAGAKDALAVVDVYSTTDSKVKTSLIDRVTDIGSSVSSFIVSNPQLLDQIMGSFVNNNGSVAFDNDTLLTTLTNSMLGNGGRGMVSGLCDGLRRGIGTNSGNRRYGGRSVYGNSIDNISIDDLICSRSITNYVGNLLGNIDVVKTLDLDAEYAVLGPFLNEAIRMGATGAFEAMLSAYDGKSEYDYVVRQALATSVSQAVYSGNLDGIKKLADKLGNVAFISEMPDCINRILTFYHFPLGLEPKDYQAELTKFTALLTQLDANWFTYPKKVKNVVGDMVVETTQSVKRIEPFTYASEDAKALFMTSATYKTSVMVAPSYPIIDCKSKLQEMYPLLLFKQ